MIGIGSSQISTSLDTVRADLPAKAQDRVELSCHLPALDVRGHSLQALDDPLQLIEVMRLEPATGDSLAQLARAR